MDELEKKAQEIENSIKQAKEDSAEVKKELQETKKAMEDNKTDIEKKFNNIDESLKEMKEAMEQKEEMKEQTFGQAVKSVLESEEFKSKMNDVKERKLQGFTMEVKLATSAMTGDVNRTQQNINIYGPSFAALSFFNRVPRYPIGADKNRFMWVEASFMDATGYVGEGEEGSDSSATATEKYREVAKIHNRLPFTTEMLTDMSFFLNWAQNQARNAVIAKVDTLMWNGDGADGSQSKRIYGIKGAATAFDATKAGLKNAIVKPDTRALLLAMKAQIKKETKGAYNPNIVYMSEEGLVEFINLRDSSGNQLNFPDFQKALGCEIVSTDKFSGGEILMADINAIQLHEKTGFEIEVERKANTDSYVMYLRWRGNVAIPGEPAKAVLYVEDAETAISALAKA